MNNLTWIAVTFLCLLSVSAGATVLVVDPGGGGDFETVPDAWPHAASNDTISLVPGTHLVGWGDWRWPLTLGEESPWVIGRDGAESTVLLGDGEASAFFIPEGEVSAKMHFLGITFRDIADVFERGGVYQEGGGHLVFRSNRIENCGSWYALDAQWCLSASCVISDCVITGNPARGIYSYHYFGVIEDCEISHNGGTGIFGNCCEEPIIRRNHIHHNASYGIRATWMYTVEDNVIEHNGAAGILTRSGSIHRRNVIVGNEIGIEHWGTSGQIHENDIYGNTTYDVVFRTYNSTTFDLTMNWWGTTDPEEISAHIWDCEDDPAVGVCAIFDPWCDAPGCPVTPVHRSTWGGIKALYR